MKAIEKVFYLLCPILFGVGLLISTVVLQGCNETETCPEDGEETVLFTPEEIGTPQSEISIRVNFKDYYKQDCLPRSCFPVEIRYVLYGKINLGGEEKLLESFREDEIEGATGFDRKLMFNTSANSSFRLVVETDVPNNCVDETAGFTQNSYEYTFETPLIEELQGIVYEPVMVVVNDFGAFTSGVPTEPLNEYVAPLTFEIVSITPASGAEYISIPDKSTGQLVSTDLINAGKGEYIVDVQVRDVRGANVLLEDVFTFDVRAAPGEIIGASYGSAMYINPNSPTSVTSNVPAVEGAGSFGDYSFVFSQEQTAEATAILPHLSIDAITGAVTITNTQSVVSIIDDLQPVHLNYPVIYFRIDIDISNTFNTYKANLYVRTHISGMAYALNTLRITSKTQVLSSDAPIILNPDTEGYTYSYEPIYEYITINPNTGIITVSGENAIEVGTRNLIITANSKSGGNSDPLITDFSIKFLIE